MNVKLLSKRKLVTSKKNTKFLKHTKKQAMFRKAVREVEATKLQGVKSTLKRYFKGAISQKSLCDFIC